MRGKLLFRKHELKRRRKWAGIKRNNNNNNKFN